MIITNTESIYDDKGNPIKYKTIGLVAEEWEGKLDEHSYIELMVSIEETAHKLNADGVVRLEFRISENSLLIYGTAVKLLK